MICQNKKCNNEHDGTYGSGKFCSRACANSRKQTNETKEAICQSCGIIVNIKKRASSKNYICNDCKLNNLQCKYCGKDFKSLNKEQQFCSRNCQSLNNINNTNMSSIGGIKSAGLKCLRSKDEVKLFDLCNNYFNEEVTHNEEVIENKHWDADIIIRDLKIAILWNGPWHYREMNFGTHSLKQVQNRDRIKIKLFKENGWTVYIFEDREYTPEAAFKELICNI